MSTIRPELPGVPRNNAWVPIHTPSRRRGADLGGAYSAAGSWTPFGVTALAHRLDVNLTSGALVISAEDMTMPYHRDKLRILRSLDVQEQFAQEMYLESYPNTDPRFHLFGNWKMQREPRVSSVWGPTPAEMLVTYGAGSGSLFYRVYPEFVVNSRASTEEILRAYGVPGRTLGDIGWRYDFCDCLLRTRQGEFALLTGEYEPTTMVDREIVRL
jgi:hypothetical protein